MMGILLYHYYYHSQLYDLYTINSYKSLFNFLMSRLFSMGGRISNLIFFIISGYYSVKNSHLRYTHIFKLIAEMYFYSVIIAIIAYYGLGEEIQMSYVLLPILYGQKFMVEYIQLFFLFPFFNQLEINLDKRKHLTLIIILFAFIYVLPIGWNYETTDYLLCYIIGGFIRLHMKREYFDGKMFKVFAIVAYSLFFGPIFVTGFYGYSHKLSETTKGYAVIFRDMSTIPCLMAAIVTFTIFLTFNFHNRIVNNIASCVPAVYLIHENNYLINWIWWKWSPAVHYFDSWSFVIHALIKTTIIFVFCYLVDQGRCILFSLCKNIAKSQKKQV